MSRNTRCRTLLCLLFFVSGAARGWCQAAGAQSFDNFTPETAALLAKENSKELLIKRIQLRITKKEYAAGLRGQFPSLSLSFSADDSVTRRAPDSRIKRLAVTLSQPVLSGGERIGEKKMKEIFLELERQKILAVEENIEDTAWMLAHRTIIAREKARLQREALGLAEEKLRIVQMEHELGLITELELLDTQIEAHNMRIGMRETELVLSELEFSLKKICGLPPDGVIDPRGTVEISYKPRGIPFTTEELKELTLKSSPALKEMEFQTRTKEEALRRMRRSRAVPNVNIDLSLFLEGDRFPLREAGFSVKFSIDFNNPFFPIRTALSASQKGSGRVSRGASAAGPIAAEIMPFMDLESARLALYKERLGLAKKQRDTAFELEQTCKRYLNLRARIEGEQKTAALMRQKQEILEEKLALGEIRQADLLSAGIERAEKEMLLLERILELIETGRAIEKTAGLVPGTIVHAGSEGGGEE